MKKSKSQGIRSRINYLASAYLHLSRMELYRMNPGIFYDMVQLYTEAHRHGAPEDDID